MNSAQFFVLMAAACYAPHFTKRQATALLVLFLAMAGYMGVRA